VEQEAEQGKRIFLVNTTNVPIDALDKKGAEKTQVQYLVDERQGSNRFALRLYTVQKGGHTPLDQHPYEHHVHVMSGQGLLRQSKEPNAVHQFSNNKDEPFTFLCVKGNPKLYTGPEQPVPDDTERNYC